MARRNRLARSVVLACLTAAVGIAWLARELDLDTERLLDFLVTSVGFVGLMVLLAAVAAAVLRFLRR